MQQHLQYGLLAKEYVPPTFHISIHKKMEDSNLDFEILISWTNLSLSDYYCQIGMWQKYDKVTPSLSASHNFH